MSAPSSYRPPTEQDRQLVDGVWRERKHGIEPPKQETDMTKAMLAQGRMSPQKVGLDLKMQKAMLLKQMALLDDRCAATHKILGKKTRDRRAHKLLAQAHAHLPRSSLSKQGQRVIEKPAQLPKRPPVRRTTPSITPNPDVLIHKLKRTAKTVNAQKIQNRTRPHKGPCSGVFRKQKVEETVFPTRYERGELPCAIEHGACHNTLSWACPLLQLDYEHYLPIFLDGIRCTDARYKFVARQGFDEMIEEAKGFPDCVLPVVPALIKPIRLALATHDPDIVVAGLNALQKVVLSNYGVGEAMVPFYRQLLQPMNLFYTKRQNIGDQIFYGQRKGTDLGTAVLETLELLEKTGGPNAFVNIKSYVPVRESPGRVCHGSISLVVRLDVVSGKG